MPVASARSVFGQLAERYDDAVNYRLRPKNWCQDKLGEHVWSKQQEILDSLVANRYTAAVSAHDLGKSKAAANAITWWIDSHPPGSAFVVSTAPTAAQVSAILWREALRNHSKAKLMGKINRAGYPQWYIGDGELVGYGRKPADYEESAFQGIHARYVLVVIDEAGGVARHLYDAVDALATNQEARVLAIGNPDDPGSHFASICKPGSDWHVIHMDGLRSPNFTEREIVGDTPAEPRYPLLKALMEAEAIPYSTEAVPADLRPLLLSPLWVEERIRRWAGVAEGSEHMMDSESLGQLIRRRADASALFQAKVRGIFPTSTATGVVPLGWVQQAINRWHDYEEKHCKDGVWDYSHVPNPSRNVVGVDVAYGGQDETAIAIRYGAMIARIARARHADTVETADEAAVYLHVPQAAAVVDVIGIGAGVYDTLRRYRREGLLRGDITLIPFNAARRSYANDKIGEFKFMNDRAAAWWKFRELLDPSRGSKLMLPDDERMIEELTTVKYKHLAGGTIQIESKDDIRKRLGRSTDSADAVIQAFWIEGLSANMLPDPMEYATTAAQTSHESQYAGYASFTEEDMVAAIGGQHSTATMTSNIGTDYAGGPISYTDIDWSAL